MNKPFFPASKPILLSVLLFSAASLSSAFAQSGLELNKELQPKNGEIQLPKGNGDGTKPKTNKPKPTNNQPAISPYKAEGGSPAILNCTGSGIVIHLHNSTGQKNVRPVKVIPLGNGQSTGLKCGTRTCKIEVVPSQKLFGPFRGKMVVKSRNIIVPTNSASIARGCSVY